jgi:hypothetical protein
MPKHSGWKLDIANARLAAQYDGTEVFDMDANDMAVAVAASFASTVDITGAVGFSGAIGVIDDISIELGTDDDSVLHHKSGTLAANTTLADVLTGTPVSAALAANSLMLSNNTANGDIGIYVNTGTVSHQAVFIDSSAKLIALGQTGWALNMVEAAVKLTLGTPGTFASTQPTNTLVIKVGTAPAGAITTSVGLFTDGTTMKKIIADGTVSDVQT